MLWLIQRDFLQGKTVGAMVTEALAPQPNPHGDRDIDQVRETQSCTKSDDLSRLFDQMREADSQHNSERQPTVVRTSAAPAAGRRTAAATSPTRRLQI